MIGFYPVRYITYAMPLETPTSLPKIMSLKRRQLRYTISHRDQNDDTDVNNCVILHAYMR